MVQLDVSGDTTAIVDYTGSVMQLEYYRVPPLEEFDFQLMMKLSHSDQNLPMNIFSRSHAGGGSVSVDLNMGTDGKPAVATVRVKIVDSLGVELEFMSEGLFVLFSNRWVRLRVIANLEDGDGAIFIGKSKTENDAVAFTLQNVIPISRGRPVMRQLKKMSALQTFGTSRDPYSGWLREILVTANGAVAHKIDLITGTLQTNGIDSGLSVGVSFDKLVVVPPLKSSFDGVIARIVPDTLGNWAGTVCDVCRTGFYGAQCNKRNCDINVPSDCNTAEAGQCTAFGLDTPTPWWQCVCTQFYDGERCERCMPPPVVATRTSNTAPLVCGAADCTTVPCAGKYFPVTQSTYIVDCTDAQGNPTCLPPQTQYDECNCALTPVPECAAGTLAGGCCQVGVVPKPEPAVSYNCMGYANLYIACPKTDSCGRPGALAPTCLGGTAGRRQYPLYCQQLRAEGCDRAATRSRAVLTSATNGPGWSESRWLQFMGDCPGICSTGTFQEEGGLCGKCPEIELAIPLIDCPGVLRNHIPKQKFKEDFCGCASPRVPVCLPETTVAWNQGVDGDLTCQAVCPDWLVLYQAAGVPVDATTGEILVNCGNWPAPEWIQQPCSFDGTDPCECDLPKFRCTQGTEGFCDSAACPVWGPAPLIDCKGALPPKVNTVVEQVCGCDWPKEPVCAEGTGPKSLCPEDQNRPGPRPTDCKGAPLFGKSWVPGNPRWDFTRGCLGCRLDSQPESQCIEGTQCPKPIPCQAPSDKAPAGAFFNTPCPQVEYVESDCQGQEILPEPIDLCWCPPPRISVCAPIDPFGSCYANSSACAPYVCGLGRFTKPIPGDKCRTTCMLDTHCTEGNICNNNICVPEGTQPPPLGGCLADPTICEPYACDLVTGACRQECWTDKHCLGGLKLSRNESGYRCSFPTLTGLTQVDAFQKIGAADDSATQRTQPPNLCGSSGSSTTASVQTDPGRCIWSTRDPNACFSHNTCGLYSCGKNNTQIYFANAKCRSSCSNDAHCNHKAHCQRSTGMCVKGSAGSPQSCSTKDYDFCTPFACGKHITLAPLPTAVCRTTCDEDGHCLYFYQCVGGRCVATQTIIDSHQPTPLVPEQCYTEGQVWYGNPWKCLRIPLPLRGNPMGRTAYALPRNPPAPSIPIVGKCTTHRECQPYRCGSLRGLPSKSITEPLDCQVTCEIYDDCAEGFACSQKRCIQLRAPAAPCKIDRQCASGHCVDGVCCNTACNLPCQRCTNIGVCDWVDVGDDDRNDCGRCQTCVEAIAIESAGALRKCGSVEDGKDTKFDCGITGVCNGNGKCRCHANRETGFWAGEGCEYCAKGYSGNQCLIVDAPYAPPAPVTPGAPPQDNVLQLLERRSIQFPVRVLDYSTQVIPGNINNLIGRPDATEAYYVKDEPNRASAWEPRQVCFSSYVIIFL